MPRINLLPWRETLKKERELRFSIIMGASLAFAGLIVLSVHMYMQSLINYQEARNNFLKDQIEQAEAKIKEIEELDQKKQALIDRMEVIQKLEESRPQVVHLFDEMVKKLPNGVFFKKMEQKSNKITLEGIAQSDARVSSLMTNFEKSDWLKTPKIIKIETKEIETKDNKKSKKHTVSEFKLEVVQTTPKEKEAAQKAKEAAKNKGKKPTDSKK